MARPVACQSFIRLTKPRAPQKSRRWIVHASSSSCQMLLSIFIDDASNRIWRLQAESFLFVLFLPLPGLTRFGCVLTSTHCYLSLWYSSCFKIVTFSIIVLQFDCCCWDAGWLTLHESGNSDRSWYRIRNKLFAFFIRACCGLLLGRPGEIRGRRELVRTKNEKAMWNW